MSVQSLPSKGRNGSRFTMWVEWMKYLKDSQIKLSNCKPLRRLSRSLVLLEGFLVSRTCFHKISMVSGRCVGDVVGENTAHMMEALGGSGMAENKSWKGRWMVGAGQAQQPELPEEIAGGFDDIESNQEQGYSGEMC